MWITPKTDWVATDYFNVDDYNRIVGNINYLKELAATVIKDITIDSMTADKGYTSIMYAADMNAIENSLATINENTYDFDFGESQSYTANGATPLYDEFNRIESATLKLYNTLQAEIKGLPRLAIVLGRKQLGMRL